MISLLNFNKPETAIQWVIFLAAIGVTLSSPAGSRAFLRELNKYLNNRSNKTEKYFNSNELSRALYYLKKRKLLSFKNINGKTTLILTERGKKRKLQYDIDNLVISKPKSWDKKWRLVMFDIPESYKKAREAFREKLKELRFLRFQKSVWIYPYPCHNEVDFISEIFSIAQHIIVLVVQIDYDQPLRRRFNL